eukprot:TRINITY_DN2061_c0_g1_i1.p1 TRINITY_DN2061_c0_g1~~TRINITY_DN2061_c0_g1_i1.p1  ORF type:complete len:1714 (+),score=312.26 TRINITY_DN2061_c0_g1_i1:645-5144(+)
MPTLQSTGDPCNALSSDIQFTLHPNIECDAVCKSSGYVYDSSSGECYQPVGYYVNECSDVMTQCVQTGYSEMFFRFNGSGSTENNCPMTMTNLGFFESHTLGENGQIDLLIGNISTDNVFTIFKIGDFGLNVSCNDDYCFFNETSFERMDFFHIIVRNGYLSINGNELTIDLSDVTIDDLWLCPYCVEGITFYAIEGYVEHKNTTIQGFTPFIEFNTTLCTETVIEIDGQCSCNSDKQLYGPDCAVICPEHMHHTSLENCSLNDGYSFEINIHKAILSPSSDVKAVWFYNNSVEISTNSMLQNINETLSGSEYQILVDTTVTSMIVFSSSNDFKIEIYDSSDTSLGVIDVSQCFEIEFDVFNCTFVNESSFNYNHSNVVAKMVTFYELDFSIDIVTNLTTSFNTTDKVEVEVTPALFLERGLIILQQRIDDVTTVYSGYFAAGAYDISFLVYFDLNTTVVKNITNHATIIKQLTINSVGELSTYMSTNVSFLIAYDEDISGLSKTICYANDSIPVLEISDCFETDQFDVSFNDGFYKLNFLAFGDYIHVDKPYIVEFNVDKCKFIDTVSININETSFVRTVTDSNVSFTGFTSVLGVNASFNADITWTCERSVKLSVLTTISINDSSVLIFDIEDAPNSESIQCSILITPVTSNSTCVNLSELVKTVSFTTPSFSCPVLSEPYVIDDASKANPFDIVTTYMDLLCTLTDCYVEAKRMVTVKNYGVVSGMFNIIWEGDGNVTDIDFLLDGGNSKQFLFYEVVKSLSLNTFNITASCEQKACYSSTRKTLTNSFVQSAPCPSNLTQYNFAIDNVVLTQLIDDSLVIDVYINSYSSERDKVHIKGFINDTEVVMVQTSIVTGQTNKVAVIFNNLENYAQKYVKLKIEAVGDTLPCLSIYKKAWNLTIKLNSQSFVQLNSGFNRILSNPLNCQKDVEKQTVNITFFNGFITYKYGDIDSVDTSTNAITSSNNQTLTLKCFSNLPACDLILQITHSCSYGFEWSYSHNFLIRNQSYFPDLPSASQIYENSLFISYTAITSDFSVHYLSSIANINSNPVVSDNNLPVTINTNVTLICGFFYKTEMVSRRVFNYTVLPTQYSKMNLLPTHQIYNYSILIPAGINFLLNSSDVDYLKPLPTVSTLLTNEGNEILMYEITFYSIQFGFYPLIIKKLVQILPKCSIPSIQLVPNVFWYNLTAVCNIGKLKILANSAILLDSSFDEIVVLPNTQIDISCEFISNVCSTNKLDPIVTDKLSTIPTNMSTTVQNNSQISLNEFTSTNTDEGEKLCVDNTLTDVKLQVIKGDSTEQITINSNCVYLDVLGPYSITPLYIVNDQVMIGSTVNFELWAYPPNITVLPPCGTSINDNSDVMLGSNYTTSIKVFDANTSSIIDVINSDNNVSLSSGVRYHFIAENKYYYENLTLVCQFTQLKISVVEAAISIITILSFVGITVLLLVFVFPNAINCLIKTKQRKNMQKFDDSFIPTVSQKGQIFDDLLVDEQIQLLH